MYLIILDKINKLGTEFLKYVFEEVKMKEELVSAQYCVIATTYIEHCFQKCCSKAINGDNFWSNWLYSKKQYIAKTKTTIYEFMNYSLHDASHSVNILQSIERVLGRDRVEKLELGDLWLILHAAYGHDIGMASDYDDLIGLWKNEEFNKFISEGESSSDKSLRKAVKRILAFDQFVKYCEGKNDNQKAETLNWDNIDAWPLECRKDITYLMSSFMRKKHGERSRKYFEKILAEDEFHEQDRLIKTLGKIVELHTADIDEILRLEKVELGLEDEDVHPRFVALLLRLADSLDLDNNRFDILSLKHFGMLPEISTLHYKKHKSITHLLIRPNVIEVTAESDEFEVCRIHKMWFEMIKENVKFLITYWKDITPDGLEGCLMGMPVLKIFHNGEEFKSGFGRKFKLDRVKLLDLFKGNNIYATNFDFIREIVQNGMDANRIALYQELQSGIKRLFYLKDPELELSEIKPFDLKKQAYDSFPIEIIISECLDERGKRNSKKFCLKIKDVGIGIDEQGISALANIGMGWKKRPNFDEIINDMRQWLKPTGGFGIGIHSAFMALDKTDKIELLTRTEENEGYKIIIQQNDPQDESNDDIVVKYDKEKHDRGTEVSLALSFDKFNSDKVILDNYEVKDVFNKETFNYDVFNYDERLEIIYKMICKYSMEYFANSLMPIKIQLDSKRRKRQKIVQSDYFFACDEDGIKYMPDYYSAAETKEDIRGKTLSRILKKSPKKAGIKYKLQRELKSISLLYDELSTLTDEKSLIAEEEMYFLFDESDKALRIWNDATGIFYYIKLHEITNKGNLDKGDRVEKYVSYKNVKVIKEWNSEEVEKSAHITDMVFDVMGHKVQDCLVVSRNRFLQSAKESFLRIKPYAFAYIKMLRTLLDQENAFAVKDRFVISVITGQISTEELIGERLRELAKMEQLSVYRYEKADEEGEYGWQEKSICLSEIWDGLIASTAVIAVLEDSDKEADMNSRKSLTGIEEAWDQFCQNVYIINDEHMSKVFSKYCSYTETRVLAVRKPQKVKDKDVLVRAFKILNKGTKTETTWDTWLWNQEEHSKTKAEQEADRGNPVSEAGQNITKALLPDEMRKREIKVYTKNDNLPKNILPLVVEQVPYRKKDAGDTFYYITPYNETIGEKLADIIKSKSAEREIPYSAGNFDSDLGLTPKQLLDIVTSDPSFKELCEWVYEHQRKQCTYSQEQIRDAYIALIKEEFRRLIP